MDIKKIRKEKINRLVVYEIMQWIDEHLEEPLKVEDVSAKAGYSKWHFQRMFKEVAGISLGKYIKLEKLRRAYFFTGEYGYTRHRGVLYARVYQSAGIYPSDEK